MKSSLKHFHSLFFSRTRSLESPINRLFATKKQQINADDPASVPPQSDEADADIARIMSVPPPLRALNEPLSTKRSRLLYSSRKRGILETDLLLSTFSKKFLNDMTEVELQEYDLLMEENDWDIYYWVTGSKTPPPRVANMSIFPTLVTHGANTEKQILRMPEL